MKPTVGGRPAREIIESVRTPAASRSLRPSPARSASICGSASPLESAATERNAAAFVTR